MKFELHQAVEIIMSKEQGLIMGRAEYVNSEPMYLLRYVSTDGRAIESWWAENALS